MSGEACSDLGSTILSRLEPTEARELVEARRMAVPKKVSADHELTHPHGPG